MADWHSKAHKAWQEWFAADCKRRRDATPKPDKEEIDRRRAFEREWDARVKAGLDKHAQT